MSLFSRKNIPFNTPPADGLVSQSTQHSGPVCTWSARAPQSGSSPWPFPRDCHTLTVTATAAGELFLFGGYAQGCASGDLYVLSTRDFSTAILKTNGEAPSPRAADDVALISTSLLICGGETNAGDQNVLYHDSLYLLNLGTSNLLISSPTPADHSLPLQYRESGPALWPMGLGPMDVTPTPRP
jgi:Kelch motif